MKVTSLPVTDALTPLLMSADPEIVSIGKSLVIDPMSPSGLSWKVAAGRWGRINPGTPAGSLKKNGYWYVFVGKKLRLSHRIVWLLATGNWPGEGVEIDHINGNPSDNRLENLRETTRSENQQNTHKARKNNLSSGVLGVSWHKATGKWEAQIKAPGTKNKRIGYFGSIEAASAAYQSAKLALHPFSPIATASRKEDVSL